MVEKLFLGKPPMEDDIILDPGCGKGSFIEGIIRWCTERDLTLPHIVGVDSDPEHATEAKQRFSRYSSVVIEERDFLEPDGRQYDYIVGNPPYVPITRLSEDEKIRYKKRYKTARMRFDLYILFFEESLNQLKNGGRLVFITPEKYSYVNTARPLREILNGWNVEELVLIDENAFGQITAYPMITTLVKEARPRNLTKVTLRNGDSRLVTLPGGWSWMPYMNGEVERNCVATLQDVCERISCGIATGADSIFALKNESIPFELEPYAYPTISGKQIDARSRELKITDSLLSPYRRDGSLMEEDELGALGDYLRQKGVREKLQKRTCSTRGKWYEWHERLPRHDIFRPKILTKDTTKVPIFVNDIHGSILPRHTVYYLIPKDPSVLQPLSEYLNGPEATAWLWANCQRAANGFLRVQSHVLKRLPIPATFAGF